MDKNTIKMKNYNLCYKQSCIKKKARFQKFENIFMHIKSFLHHFKKAKKKKISYIYVMKTKQNQNYDVIYFVLFTIKEILC
jgi:hypothetical protein